MEHGADVGVVLGVQLDGGAGGPFQALEVAGHHLFLQGVRGKRRQAAPAFRSQGQLVQHQASKEDAEKADVERRQQKGGLQGMEAHVQDHARQFQPDHMGQAFPLPGHQIGKDGSLDLHQMALEVHGKAGEKFQPPGLGRHDADGLAVPLHRAGGDVVDQPQDFRGNHQRFQLFGKG